jgi:hypothetical protein
MMTGDFLKEVFKNKKKLLRMSDVRPCNPPHYDEISVVNLYDAWIKMPGMADYFPTTYPKGRKCARKYFFDVANTLHPNEMDKTLKNCKHVRYGADGEA